MAPVVDIARWPRRDRVLVFAVAGLGPWIGLAWVARALGVL